MATLLRTNGREFNDLPPQSRPDDVLELTGNVAIVAGKSLAAANFAALTVVAGSASPVMRARMSLFGSFHLEGPDGENLTPRGQKARAVLALVALAQRGQRSRAWLCAKLWSDRPAQQAFASLRQCLTEIRRTLGCHGERFFATDQFSVSIDLNQVSVDAVELRSALLSRCGSQRIDIPEDDFLEGLNIGDEEFEEWLAMERSRWADIKDEFEQARLATAWPAAAAVRTYGSAHTILPR